MILYSLAPIRESVEDSGTAPFGNLPRRAVAAIAFGVLGAAVGDHGADVGIGAAAEPAAERTVRIPLEGFVVAAVRIARTAVRHERTEFRSLFPAVDADERSALGSLEKDVVAAPGGMERARVVQEGPGVRVRPSAVFAVFAHGVRCLILRQVLPPSTFL